MAIVPKTMLDQILVQFSSGAAHQTAKPGEIEGAHLIEIEYLVDDQTGGIVGTTQNPLNGMARVLDPAKVKDVLGEQFSIVAAQLADAQRRVAAAEQALAQMAAEISERVVAAEVDARLA